MALTSTQETLFFPLLGRAAAAQRWPRLFSDRWAQQAADIAAAEGTTARSLDTYSQTVYGLRHVAIVAEIKDYLRDHPGAAVVNIGCGLDSLAADLAGTDHGTLYNLDFPEVLAVRSRWLPQDGSVDLPYSLTDVAWLDHVDGTQGMIAVATGVMYYIEVGDAAAIIDAMAQRFPAGRFIYDAESPMITRGSEKQIARAGVTASMPFQVKDPFSVRFWSRSIADVDIEFNISHCLSPSARRELPLRARVLHKLMEKIRGMYLVRVSFAG
ncbi:class I SAM-dependent methyltransferase [uncultured Corynebacterium sp.]|uniref:class I SAM-dependent methyltransferase n=1 Tax=uncultured Corynebacterium sp. TaxID=159447 RepID=UPI0025D0B050|nr:class I SAM-dependent methyltransferase [uncultured Corynebacterium sp.]